MLLNRSTPQEMAGVPNKFISVDQYPGDFQQVGERHCLHLIRKHSILNF